MKLNIYHTTEEVLNGLAEYFIKVANEAIQQHDSFNVALSGGTSPKKLYALLASDSYKSQVDWSKIYFFFGDERYVPATNPQSNFQMVKKVLFEPMGIEDSHIFPVNTMLQPDNAAQQYATDISVHFDGGVAKFDLILLGLGDNSHTASLFPYTPILHEVDATVKSVFLTNQQAFRISFTAPMINNAHNVAFLVYGESKAIAVHNVLEEALDIQHYPAQLISLTNGNPAKWFIDDAAAKKLA